MDPFPVLDTLVETVGDLGDATLQINLHDEIFDPANHFYAPQAGARLLDYANIPTSTSGSTRISLNMSCGSIFRR